MLRIMPTNKFIKKLLTTSLAAILLLIFLSFCIYAEEVSKEEYEKGESLSPLLRSFAGVKHGGQKCVYCHALIIPDREYAKMFLEQGCRCHKGDIGYGYSVNMDKVREIHGTKHCKRCHASTLNVTKEIFHRKIHKRISCTKCHIIEPVNFTISVPKSMECKNCHNMDIHYIHADKLNKVCYLCHGSNFASRYTVKELRKIGFTEKEIKKYNLSKEEGGEEKVEKRGFITISKILAFIVDLLF